MLDHQFYPSTYTLACKCHNKFRKKTVIRMLDPSAGRGDLLVPQIENKKGSWVSHPIDCIEIDLDNQAVLRSKGLSVIGHDFLAYQGATLYSHIIMNPPFNQGAKHCIHAWELLYAGELVAILNAETLRNPYTKERRVLAHLVDQYSASEPEYLVECFVTPETQRRTEVEIVIIHLEKVASFTADFIGDLEQEADKDVDLDIETPHELMLPASVIENRVITFQCAVAALKESIIAKVKAAHLKRRLGLTMIEMKMNQVSHDDALTTAVAEDFNREYAALKDAAWTSILTSSDVTNRLSEKSREKLEAEFAYIAGLEFSADNIYAFIQGLIDQQQHLQMAMLCEVFDLIGKHHPDNKAYYRGWKSNTKHRASAFRIMTSRFILPTIDRRMKEAYSMSCKDLDRLADIDKVFAMLDSKVASATYGLKQLFTDRFDDLYAGERLTCDYFDVRLYVGTGTMHFFPRRSDLIDRLNITVGKHRQWIPQQDLEATASFWTQYTKAEKVRSKMKFSPELHNLLSKLEHLDSSDAEYCLTALDGIYCGALAALNIAYNPDELLHQEPTHREAELLSLPLVS